MSRIEIARTAHGRADALERAVDRASRKQAIEIAVAAERRRCINIARFAEKFCTTDLGAGVARSIAEAIQNSALGDQQSGDSK